MQPEAAPTAPAEMSADGAVRSVHEAQPGRMQSSSSFRGSSSALPSASITSSFPFTSSRRICQGSIPCSPRSFPSTRRS